MTFKTLENRFGDVILNETDLVLRCIRDAIYLPFSPKVFFDRDPSWGIYDSEGVLVEEASYVRGPEQWLVGQSKSVDLSSIDFADDEMEEMVYGGPIIPHYGHFIISSLARMWAVNGRTPALFHSSPSLHTHGAVYLKQLLDISGISSISSFSFDSPKKIKRLFVPQAAFIEQFYVSPYYFKSMRKMSVVEHRATSFAGKKVFLSKSQLKSGVSRIIDEEVIDEAFRENGFLIVYPEQLSIRDQIHLFNQSSLIAGTSSSAFHTLALAHESHAKRCIFVLEEAINSNFLLLDLGSSAAVKYYDLTSEIERVKEDCFDTSWKAKDIHRVAKYMVEASLAVLTSVY